VGELQRAVGMAVIFVTMTFGVAVGICDRVGDVCRAHSSENGDNARSVMKPAIPITQGMLT